MLDLVADDNVYITYESSAGPKYGDGSRHCLASAVNEHCTPSLCEVRQRSDRVWEGGGGGGGHTTWRRGRGSTCSLY